MEFRLKSLIKETRWFAFPPLKTISASAEMLFHATRVRKLAPGAGTGQLNRQKSPNCPRNRHGLQCSNQWEFAERRGKILDASLDRERTGSLRDDLSQRTGKLIRAAVPCTTADNVPARSIDSLFWNSRSHEMTKHWNGHWAISNLTWTLMCGRRPYLLNRVQHSGHINLIKYHSSQSKGSFVTFRRGLPKDKLAAAPPQMTGAGAIIGMAFGGVPVNVVGKSRPLAALTDCRCY
jgi:hypothetical protein